MTEEAVITYLELRSPLTRQSARRWLGVFRSAGYSMRKCRHIIKDYASRGYIR